MVPLPSSAENHQLHNAKAVETAGAGRLVEERDLARLADAWQALLDPPTRRAAAGAAQKRSPQGAAARLAQLIEASAKQQTVSSAVFRGSNLETRAQERR